MTKTLTPPATIGIIGGGQLGQMMALAAKPMGYHVIVLDPTPNAPAAQIADKQIIATYDDVAALQHLAEQSDVLTYEFENVDLKTLESLGDITPLPQGTHLLEITKNRLAEKNFLKRLGLPVARFSEVRQMADLDQASRVVGFPAILKTVEGGYDGHGQWDLPDAETLAELLAHWDNRVAGPFILEQRIEFDYELSIMVTRDGQNQVRTWPMTINQHQNHILHTSTTTGVKPIVAEKAIQIANNIAQAFKLKGILGIEMFVRGDSVYVNELAPRPHNSGHLTIEATNISQFEGHLRSILGLPIPEITLHEPAMMLNLLGDNLTIAQQELNKHPEWHFHDYGKAQIKPNRKMGHITVLGHPAIAQLTDWGQKHADN
ncbi:5-(carboxyamino)imidazole ribonucleotide synthase [Weissella uvarum]|uniref:5-(carboxyamino)imidazole ribonucleotide synthase n=1 Tax=Weissella uvarum TaxID=1479233 RepID=UPI001EF94A30|nr:5-(carboxyamino)imidazole ribonucleotide synthase [Weissella uvarum]MBM7617499.1 5-(carboxyamino)imidazole ribonucleotide synthase [Weissella uvarum]